MLASNHALTGALIGLSISNPAVAIPLAFASHFALDAIPHHGEEDLAAWLKSSLFRRLLVAEGLFCFGIVVVLALTQPHNWLVACLCAFFATSPDMFWLGQFIRGQKGKKIVSDKSNWFLDFHAWVQWYEKRNGIYVEVPVLVLLVSLFGYKIF